LPFSTRHADPFTHIVTILAFMAYRPSFRFSRFFSVKAIGVSSPVLKRALVLAVALITPADDPSSRISLHVFLAADRNADRSPSSANFARDESLWNLYAFSLLTARPLYATTIDGYCFLCEPML